MNSTTYNLAQTFMKEREHVTPKDSAFWREAVQAAIDDGQAGVMDVLETTNHLVDALENEIATLRAEVDAAAAWIPIEEPPQEVGEYLVLLTRARHGRELIRVGEWDGDSWYLPHILPGIVTSVLLAWMPLPQARAARVSLTAAPTGEATGGGSAE